MTKDPRNKRYLGAFSLKLRFFIDISNATLIEDTDKEHLIFTHFKYPLNYDQIIDLVYNFWFRFLTKKL